MPHTKLTFETKDVSTNYEGPRRCKEWYREAEEELLPHRKIQLDVLKQQESV